MRPDLSGALWRVTGRRWITKPHSRFRVELLRQLQLLLHGEKSGIGTKIVEFRFHLHEY
jgi:hypothetical protein